MRSHPLGWKPILGWLQWLFTSRAELAPNISVSGLPGIKWGWLTQCAILHLLCGLVYIILKKSNPSLLSIPLTNLFSCGSQVFTELCPGILVSGFQEYRAQQTFTLIFLLEAV